MKGFFYIPSRNVHTKGFHRPLSCESCGLYRSVLSPKMEVYGKGRLGILNIGEAPGEVEDKRGKPWQGKAGRVLQRKYKQLGVDLFEDCWNINAVMCRPTTAKGTNRTPTTQEIAACRSRVLSYIKELKPKVIILLGGVPIQSVIGSVWKKDLGGIMKWRGWQIPDRTFHARICPTFHPSYVMRMDQYPDVDLIWEKDLKAAFELVNRPALGLPLDYEQRNIRYLRSPKDIVRFIERLEWGIYFDYETTGLKPYREGHRIVSMSISTGREDVAAFPMPTKGKALHVICRMLEDSNIKKAAHNMKFEHLWSKEILRVKVEGWEFDTMLAAHVLDNRPGVTGLKFQVYVNFGVPDYDSEISPWLKSKEKGSHSFNRLEEFVKRYGIDPVLTYNALDSLFGWKLMEKQQLKMRWQK